MRIAPASIRKRLKAAFRILFGKGDEGVCCSFCGKSRHATNWIVAGPGVAICGDCANIAVDVTYFHIAPPVKEGFKPFVVGPMVEQTRARNLAIYDHVRGWLDETAAGMSARVICWHARCGNSNVDDYISAAIAVETNVDTQAFDAEFKRRFKKRWDAFEASRDSPEGGAASR